MVSRRHFLATSMALPLSSLALAKTFPDKYVKLIIPYSAGGPGDYLARAFADNLGKEISGSVIVENKPGGGSIIGTKYAAASKNDGYSLLQVTSSQYINRLLYGPSNSYVLTDLFEPVSYNFEMPMVLVVPKSKNIKTLAQLVEYAKKNNVSYGSGSIGTIGHLTSELLKKKTKMEAINVPYTSNGSAMVDLLSGRLDFYFATPVDVYARIKNGELIALALTSPQRDPNIPDVPTMKELGHPDIDAMVSWGYMLPKGVDAEIVQKYKTAISHVISKQGLVNDLNRMGIQVVNGNSGVLLEKIRSENQKWTDIVKEQNIQVK